jgi:hypothetical protein
MVRPRRRRCRNVAWNWCWNWSWCHWRELYWWRWWRRDFYGDFLWIVIAGF